MIPHKPLMPMDDAFLVDVGNNNPPHTAAVFGVHCGPSRAAPPHPGEGSAVRATPAPTFRPPHRH